MNWVLIIVLAVLAISAFVGYHKGMLRIIYSLVSWIVVLAFVSWATPQINFYLLENTVIFDRIEEYCEGTIRASSSEQVEVPQQQTEAALLEELESDDILAELGVSVPEPVWNGIMEKTAGATETFLDESGIYTAIAEGLATFILEGISFLVALVMAWLVVHIISQLLGVVSRIPVIKGVNRTLGFLVGMVYGFMIVWLGFYVTALGSASEMGQVVVSYIYENAFLTFLYENNLVLTTILKFF